MHIFIDCHKVCDVADWIIIDALYFYRSYVYNDNTFEVVITMHT